MHLGGDHLMSLLMLLCKFAHDSNQTETASCSFVLMMSPRARWDGAPLAEPQPRGRMGYECIVEWMDLPLYCCWMLYVAPLCGDLSS